MFGRELRMALVVWLNSETAPELISGDRAHPEKALVQHTRCAQNPNKESYDNRNRSHKWKSFSPGKS